MVTQHHEAAEGGHKRLREDFRELERDQDAIATAIRGLESRVATIEKSPMNVDKVSLSPKQVMGIVSICVVLAAGMWRLQVGISDVRTAVENTAKLQDERNETLKEELRQQKAALEMRRVEIQNLSNLVQQRLGGR